MTRNENCLPVALRSSFTRRSQRITWLQVSADTFAAFHALQRTLLECPLISILVCHHTDREPLLSPRSMYSAKPIYDMPKSLFWEQTMLITGSWQSQFELLHAEYYLFLQALLKRTINLASSFGLQKRFRSATKPCQGG